MEKEQEAVVQAEILPGDTILISSEMRVASIQVKDGESGEDAMKRLLKLFRESPKDFVVLPLSCD